MTYASFSSKDYFARFICVALISVGLVFIAAAPARAAVFTVTENPTPVFSTLIPDQAYVIKDNVNYKFYYATNTFDGIKLATSSDGITWTPDAGNPVVLSDGAQAEHADVHFYSVGFAGANSGANPSVVTMYYRMWYQGVVAGIGSWRYSESPDGINWYNRMAVTQFGTPVFSAQTGAAYGIADAVYTSGASNTGIDWTFRIYVNVQWQVAPYAGMELVIMAFSSDGYNWTGYDPTAVGYATPVFGGTLDGVSFDTGHIGWFKVIKNSATKWEAFYSGGKDTTFQALNGIGYATSSDGINWVRQQTLFTTNDPVAWRNQSVWMPSVVKTGSNTYKIWFLGSDNTNIGASDWIQWKLGEADLVRDSAPPTVTATDPAGAATNISPGRSVNATFSEAMDPATITTSTFTLKKGVTPVSGTVNYSGLKATFIPNVTLDSNSVYTATITTGAQDPAWNAIAVDYTWNFTTGWNYHDWTDQGLNYTAPTGSAYYPSVIYDANGFGTGTDKYKMWYSDGAGSSYLVTSSDGVTWGAPVTIAGITNTHHVQVLYNANCFGTVPCNAGTTKYRIWFWDIGAIPYLYDISNLATAESADGINWINKTAATQNPALKLVQNVGWNRGTYGPLTMFYQPNASNTGTEPWNYRYVMYYDGTDGAHEDTGLAYSTDGLYWNAYTVNPVLSGSGVGGSQAWDCGSATYGTVYKDFLGYHYFYSGRGQDDGAGGCAFPASFNGIGYAFSTDGKTWVKDAKPIFQISDGVPYRSGRIYTPSVINDGSGILRMYFSVTDSSGSPKKIGNATLVVPAFLHIIKNVVNNNDGIATASLFNLHVKLAGFDITGSPAAGTASPGTLYALAAGTYTVSEDANTGYTSSFSGNCNAAGSIALVAGDNKTCTIINDDIAPQSGGGGGGGYSNTTPPIISDISAASITKSSTIITWQTDENSDSLVRYGLTSAYGQAAFEGILDIKHVVPITGLTAGTLYHYSVCSSDSSGNQACSVDFTFSTLAPTAPLPTYSAAEALLLSPTINIDKSLVAPPAGTVTPCVSGSLIKLPSDGNPSTQVDSAVYYCGADGKRYVFPNLETYYSWYPDFSGIIIVSAVNLAAIPIGGNVTFRPGKSMVKIQSDPKIYAVAKGGVLRWIISEAVAQSLYGLCWKKLVSDIPDAFFINYILGAPITPVDVAPAMPAATFSTTTTFTQFLTLGSSGSQVLALQDLLQCLGYFPASVTPNGYYGPTTLASVRKFQAAKGISSTGSVGPATRAALNQYTVK